MARTNYQYEKRQRDLAKKKKKEEKRLKKLNRTLEGEENSEGLATEGSETENSETEESKIEDPEAEESTKVTTELIKEDI